MANQTGKKGKSGLEQIPPIVTRPIWKDRIFWIGVATASFWLAVIWYFFLA